MNEIVKTFGIDYRLLIASTVNFVVLLFLLQKILYKPLLNVLDQRKKTIAEGLKNAQEIELKLKQTAEEERKIIHQARLEASEMIKKAETQASLQKQEMLSAAEKQTRALVSEAEKKLEQQAAAMQTTVRQELADFVILATKSVLKEQMPKSVDKQYVQALVSRLQKDQS